MTRSAIPGDFHFSCLDKPTTSLSGGQSNIFQPPHTPSASAVSSLYLTRSATSAMSTEYTHLSNPGRKRSRRDYNDGRETPTRDEELYGGETPGSPMPFVNTRYIIKGGMDTPTLKAAQLHESAGEYSDVGYRRQLTGTKGPLLGEEPGGYQSFLPLDLEGDSILERRSSQVLNSPGDGWSKVAFEVVGGVVGKVWEFCKKGAFRGFHSGGGKGFAVKNSEEGPHFTVEEVSDTFWNEEKITTAWGGDRESTPLPGQFPGEDFIPNYMDNFTPDATSERPGKRRQISSNTADDLARNWVVVPTGDTPSKPVQQPRGVALYSMPTASSASRRSVLRPASRAGATMATGGARRPMIQRVSHAGSPALNCLQGASFASPRSPGGKIPRAVGTGSPMSPSKPANVESPAAREAQRWAKVKMKEEREADLTIRRLDAQMKAMIREAKEALGTTVSVEIQDEPAPSRGIKK